MAVPVQRGADPVVAHRGARVGVRGGFLNVPQGHAGVQGGGDEGVPHAWIVVFVVLGLGHYRTARVIAVLAIVLDPVWLLQGQLTGSLLVPSGPWVFLDRRT